MQVKAVIMRPDRTNDIVIVKKKDIAGKTFQFDKTTYFLHPDRFMVTWERPLVRWLFVPTLGIARRYFNTYYYRQGMANPLPVPFFSEIIDKEKVSEFTVNTVKVTGENGTTQVTPVIETIRTVDFKKLADNGVSGEELAAIFNPWFYRTIAPNAKSAWDYIMQMLTIGTACAVVYLIYILVTGNYHESLHHVAGAAAGGAAPAPTSPTPSQVNVV